MTAVKLEDADKSQDVYLDTSAFFPLGVARAVEEGTPGWSSRTAFSQELQRARRIRDFARRDPSKTSGKIWLSILALEELMAIMRNRLLAREANSAGYDSPREMRKQDAGAWKASVSKVQTEVHRFSGLAYNEALHLGVILSRTVVSTDFQDKSAAKLRKRHREVFHKNPFLDAMDALHIVTAAEFGTKAFVTFDNAWKQSGGIDVLY